MATKEALSFVNLAGIAAWGKRVSAVRARLNDGPQCGKFAAQRFAAECAVEKARRGLPLSTPEAALVELATRIPPLYDSLNPVGQSRLRGALDRAMQDDATIMPLLHMVHTAKLQHDRGFHVEFTGLTQGTPYDLLISRDEAQAEIACNALSAEDGHTVPLSSWSRLIDRIDPDLQTWLSSHPGRYLLKMTLPNGLRAEAASLPALHSRINAMLSSAKRADYDEAAILRLDPLLLAGAQAGDNTKNMLARLRQEFGPEAQLAVSQAGSSLFVMAARGGTENQVAATMRRRLAAIAPALLSGTRPGIIAMFLEDTGREEWRSLREQLLLEGEARQFLTLPEARPVIAVTCASRYELAQAGTQGGELRFRNPMHPAAKSLTLAPAVVSTV